MADEVANPVTPPLVLQTQLATLPLHRLALPLTTMQLQPNPPIL